MLEYLCWLRRAYAMACWERDMAFAECDRLCSENARLRAELERKRGWFSF